MSRAEAFALVAARGGVPRRGVTRQTRVLVVGELGWPLLANGRPSNSLSRARTYRVPVVSERRFREWVGKATPDAEAKAYTPAQLATLSDLPPDVVTQLAIFGLIESRGGLYGFRDLAAAGARTLVLAAAGFFLVSAPMLARSASIRLITRCGCASSSLVSTIRPACLARSSSTSAVS